MDILIGVVLVVAAIASAAGVVTYEDRRLADFHVAWTTVGVALGPEEAARSGSGDLELRLPLDASNVTTVEFAVSVSGGGPRLQPVEVRVEVVGPDNRTDAKETTLGAGGAASELLTFRFDVAEVPEATTVRAASPEAAADEVAERHASQAGRGAWTVTVRIAAGALQGESFEVTAEGEATTYQAEIRLATGVEGR